MGGESACRQQGKPVSVGVSSWDEGGTPPPHPAPRPTTHTARVASVLEPVAVSTWAQQPMPRSSRGWQQAASSSVAALAA